MTPRPDLPDIVSHPHALRVAVAAATAAAAVWLADLVRARLSTQRPSLRGKVRQAVRGGADERTPPRRPPDPDGGDHRRASRRAGRPTSVRVAGPGDGEEAEGLVLDRSALGVCFASHRPLRPGAKVYLRAKAAAPESLWVGAVVRHCRDRGDHSLVGCEFTRRPPWDILLLFG